MDVPLFLRRLSTMHLSCLRKQVAFLHMQITMAENQITKTYNGVLFICIATIV